MVEHKKCAVLLQLGRGLCLGRLLVSSGLRGHGVLLEGHPTVGIFVVLLRDGVKVPLGAAGPVGVLIGKGPEVDVVVELVVAEGVEQGAHVEDKA